MDVNLMMLVDNPNQEITPKSVGNNENRPKHKIGQIGAKSAIGGKLALLSKTHNT